MGLADAPWCLVACAVMIELGSKVRDNVSGFEGIVIGVTHWLTGCDRYVVQAPSKDGKRPDPDSFDERHLKVLETPEVTGIHRYSVIEIETDAAPKQLSAPAEPGGPAYTPRQY